ncbi:gamma-glutamyltransferase family protein [Streptomyces rapamycinicus]|uniref:Gamma-glutamyltransferase n=2 Tax=Streptomyces rapamycinicus TaxID=1226757 RepID=A0A0A0NM68_STRRN|nr:gamma-glutamyltransferase [Streptomyces rapamycinicus]AGP55445.1 gamma-glutamyltransferase [Streptomyces rapamycinicus NRRL 5491]MBB4783005.1 gamma-glutamyltranspeptidase/glutathione hydrolase [Streptomyces rapamycinicus]RLV81520.1 gamma-glutamyltransferase [Streptomyces rapamycinicus NRRL 5491]UTO63452.1 gamma-glutamyltransferase [Streptomyces rapamycinicus]UTP31409.1 gamma-glutamyltransferase [Streptomyces rapamycinicus NRRL 5491]
MFTTRPTLQGTHGMVSSTHWLASQSAMAVLEDGGNAFDAAVAAGFVLHVVEPHLNGPAGEVPIILAPAGGEPTVLCGQGPAPAGATIDHYTALGLDLVPGTGPLAAAVPGAFDAWMVLLRDHGTKRLAEVLRYAIGYAEHGHPAVERIGETVETVRELFETEWTTSAELYLPDGKSPTAGRLLTNPALAATWRRLIAEAEGAGPGRETQIEAARRVWREGFVAEELADAAARPAMDSSGHRNAGTMTGDDLAAFEATYEPPLRHFWNGWTVCKAGPWSQGPVLLQQLALLPYGLNEADLGTPDFLHLLIEGGKLAMADREAWYGDAADVPLAELLSRPYNDERRALIGEQASYELRPGHPGSRTPRLSKQALAAVARAASGADGPAAGPGGGEPTVGGGDLGLGLGGPAAGEPAVDRDGVTRGDTCHLDVVDRWGNMVAATPSGGWLQSNPVIPALGFPLGTRLQMTWLDPGLPNSLTPGRRPRTTLTPSLALRGDTPVMAFGTPGGDQQDQWSTHFFLGVALRAPVRSGLDLQGAIDAPNWHQESFPGSFHPRAMTAGRVVVEPRIGEPAIAELRRRGHDVVVGDPWSEGRLCAVARDPETGVLLAAANPRGAQGYAVGR